MQTLQLSNHHFNLNSPISKLIGGISFVAAFFLLSLSSSWQQTALILIAILFLISFSYFLIAKTRVGYTLTATHFQQHLYKGGWVVKWSNIESIGICSYQVDGWHQPLPWIGIKLKHYTPYLNSICPRVASEILLTQRALLYLGVRHNRGMVQKMDNQSNDQMTDFEDIVLDSAPYTNRQGDMYSGLLGMLANRMHHQRRFYDYDIFIAAADIDRSPEDFVGLVRRYIAAVKTVEIDKPDEAF